MKVPMRILHLPARTPYVRKLHGPDFRILNDTIEDGYRIPAATSCAWLLERRPFTWFDALHLHHIEFEPIDLLTQTLEACQDAEIPVVFTAHDLEAIFTPQAELQKRLEVVAAAGTPIVCLTDAAAHDLQQLLPHAAPPVVIPHGWVIAPHLLRDAPLVPDASHRRYLLYGAIRPNRDHMSTLTNWSLGLPDPDARLHLILRALSPVDFAASAHPRITELTAIARADPRIRVTMRPYPTDTELVQAALAADALLLPYLWGSHSGQLEFAFDLGLLALSADITHARAQYDLYTELIPEPVWFDWSSGHPYLYGERFLAAVETAHERLVELPRRIDPTFLDYRDHEHQQILDRHNDLYQRRT